MKRRLPLVHGPLGSSNHFPHLVGVITQLQTSKGEAGLALSEGGRASTEPSSLFPQPVDRLVLGRVLDHQDWRLVCFVVAEPTKRVVVAFHELVNIGLIVG